jgi:putative hydrolase of the HAD superfamily
VIRCTELHRRVRRYAPIEVATAILIDYAGVLTPPLTAVYDCFADGEQVPVPALEAALAALAAPIARFECGRLEEREMERLLADQLARFAQRPIRREGLLARFAGCFTRDERVWSALGDARRAGQRIGLLTNSWLRETYPADAELAEVFDVVVMSREVGLRKPDSRIFALALERLGVQPAECTFIDDAPRNVEAAVAAGLRGVVYTGTLQLLADTTTGAAPDSRNR